MPPYMELLPSGVLSRNATSISSVPQQSSALRHSPSTNVPQCWRNEFASSVHRAAILTKLTFKKLKSGFISE